MRKRGRRSQQRTWKLYGHSPIEHKGPVSSDPANGQVVVTVSPSRRGQPQRPPMRAHQLFLMGEDA